MHEVYVCVYVLRVVIVVCLLAGCGVQSIRPDTFVLTLLFVSRVIPRCDRPLLLGL